VVPSADDSLHGMSSRPWLIVLLAMAFGGSVLVATSMIRAPESAEVPVIELEVLTEEDRDRAAEIGDEARDRSEERRERRSEREEESRDRSQQREDGPDSRDPSDPRTRRASGPPAQPGRRRLRAAGRAGPGSATTAARRR
jgi:hypothetical protein